MISDPFFPTLTKLLRERGWIERDGALHARHGSIWVDLSSTWPSSVEEFRQVIRRRMDRLSRYYEGELDNSGEETLADTSDLLEILEAVLGRD